MADEVKRQNTPDPGIASAIGVLYYTQDMSDERLHRYAQKASQASPLVKLRRFFSLFQDSLEEGRNAETEEARQQSIYNVAFDCWITTELRKKALAETHNASELPPKHQEYFKLASSLPDSPTTLFAEWVMCHNEAVEIERECIADKNALKPIPEEFIDAVLEILADPHMLADAIARAHPDVDQPPRYLELANSSIYHQTRSIIAKGQFDRSDGDKWPTGHIHCDGLIASVQIKPDPATIEYLEENDRLVWQEKAANIALEMDDETADVLDYITYEVVNQARHAEQDVTFSADRFYQLRGIQKQKSSSTGRRGGYKTEYRRGFAREVEKLGTTWIRVAEMEVIEPDEKGKRRRSRKSGVESRAIVVSARAGQLNLGGRIEPDRYRGRLGPLFASSVFGTWRQTALVSIKALGYDSYRHLPEKRLTRYLSWQWRIRQGGGNYLQPYEVATLLANAGMNISKKNPIQTKERLEKALETLVADCIVSGWQYCEGWNEAIVGSRGWTEQWKDWRVVVEPPQDIIDHYKTIPTMESTTPKTLPVNGKAIGERLQAALATLSITQLQAAEDIGINQATLSRVIRGKTPSPVILKKIVTWLDKRLVIT